MTSLSSLADKPMSRAMTAPWSLLWILGLICSSDSSCSLTSYYKSCWIRRFPGLYVDIEESQRRGAHVLKVYQEETALKCSRACCLTRNFSCNLAVFHFNTTQDSVNCFHLQCPTLESCVPHHRGNVILYNVTKGVDPDLLVFGKYFTTNVRVLPHMSSSRLNASEPLTSDKRHFNYPPNPPVRSISPASTSTKQPTTPQQTTHAGPTARDVQCNLPQCTTVVTQSTSEHVRSTTSQPKMDSKWTSTPQWASTNLRHATQMDEHDTIGTLNQSISNPSSVYTTTAHPSSTIDSTLTSIANNEPPSSSTIQQALGLQTTLATVSQNTMQVFTKIMTGTQQPLTRNTEQATSLSNSKSTKLEEYPQKTAPTTVLETVNTQTSEFAQSKTSTTTSANVLLQITTQLVLAIKPTASQITPEPFLSATSTFKTDSTLNPHQTDTMQQLATTKLLTSANILLQTSTQIIPETSTWPLRTPTQTTALSQPKETISSDTTTLEISTSTTPTITTGDATTSRHLTQSFTRTRMGNSATTGSLSSSLTAPTSSIVDSQAYPNDTKGYISRNATTGNATTGDVPRPGEDGSLTSVWHLAANTVLVALAACATIIFGCCCSVFVALSWRGRRRRKGRYRTNLRGKRGSMRLIKYVIVRESP